MEIPNKPEYARLTNGSRSQYQRERCAYATFQMYEHHQCSRKRGHGPHDAFCKQHAAKIHSSDKIPKWLQNYDEYLKVKKAKMDHAELLASLTTANCQILNSAIMLSTMGHKDDAQKMRDLSDELGKIKQKHEEYEICQH